MPAERKPARVRLFVAFTVALAFGATAAAITHYGMPRVRDVVFFWIVHNLAVNSMVEVPLGGLYVARTGPQRSVKLSPGFIVLLTAAFTVDPATATFIALLPSFPIRLLREEREPIRLIFNAGQETVSMAATAITFVNITYLVHGVGGLFLGALVAAAVGEAINILFVAGVVSIERQTKFLNVVAQMTWTIAHSLSFAIAALLVSTLYKEFGAISGVFLIMPIVALRFVRQAKLDLAAAQEETLRTFVRTIDRKSPYTRHHSEGVAEYCVALHRELGTPEKEVERRYYGALLHDVGKVAVPARILNKAEALTKDEYEAIKTHSAIGAEVVKEIDHLKDLELEILYHHERLDGRGYPHRLKGDEIPFNAKVLAVADTFDALTNDRPYRKALTTEEAVKVLRDVSGTQLDTELVEAFVRTLEAGKAVVRFPVAVDTDEHVAVETFATRT